MAVLTSDLPTLLGVSTGIAVLAGLICMVLHLFSKTKYPRHRNYADANIPPPIMYSTDTGTINVYITTQTMKIYQSRFYNKRKLSSLKYSKNLKNTPPYSLLYNFIGKTL